jgi:cation diffusion facilitator CzcD-associated flavoprotein CzcO
LETVARFHSLDHAQYGLQQQPFSKRHIRLSLLRKRRRLPDGGTEIHGRLLQPFEPRPCIRFGADVKTLVRVGQKWAVEYVQNNSSHTASFDKLMVSPGSYAFPRSPKLIDMEKFEGRVLHSLNFPEASTFQDQNVLVVGFHATAQDLVVELASHAKKVYIAHRSELTLVRL